MFRRAITFIVWGLCALWFLFLQPIWNLNVEEWAERRELHDYIDEASRWPWVSEGVIGWVDYLTGDFLVGVLAFASVILVAEFIGWVAPKAKLTRLVAQKAPISRKPSASKSGRVPFDSDHHFDFILQAKDPVVCHASRTEDGIDVVVRLVVRNRSKASLWVNVVERHVMKLGELYADQPSGGISLPMRSESSQKSVLGALRVYDDLTGKEGNGKISYLFGKSQNSAHCILDVDIDFKILEAPKNNSAQNAMAVEVTENKSSYRIKSIEDQ